MLETDDAEDPEVSMGDYAQARRTEMMARGLWKDRTLLDDLARHVAQTPDKTAIVSVSADTGGEIRLSFSDLDRRSAALAAWLAGMGVGRGDVVSFQLPNGWEMPVVHLACLRLGAMSNPLLTILRERELRFMLRLARSKVLVVPARFRGHDHAAMAARLRPDLPDLRHIVVADGREEALAPPVGFTAPVSFAPPAPDDVVQLLYTSGTTGEPKGVMHTSNTLLANLRPFAQRLELCADDVIHMPSPMSHQLGFMYGLMLPIHLGATAVLQDIFEPAEMARLVESESATFTMGATPFLKDFVEFIELQARQLPSLRYFVSAGAPIPEALVARATRVLGAHVISAWGMSENGAVTTTCPGDPEAIITGTDGCPLPGMEVQVIGPDGQPAAADEAGDLLVRGCSNFVGYFRRPGIAAFDEQGWFATGDRARKDGRGYIRILGRSKDIVIRGGENIPVVEIENLLLKHPAVTDAAIVGEPHERLGETACAFVVLRAGAAFTLGAMREHLAAEGTARPYWPERLEVRSELPRTPSGKVQKFILRQALSARQPPGSASR